MANPFMKLTETHAPEIEQAHKQTQPGMAFWAGSGPEGRRCSGCQFFNSEGKYASGGRMGQVKPGPCLKYKAMMRRLGPKIAADNRACKYFESTP